MSDETVFDIISHIIAMKRAFNGLRTLVRHNSTAAAKPAVAPGAPAAAAAPPPPPPEPVYKVILSGAGQPKYNLESTASYDVAEAHTNIVLAKTAGEYKGHKAMIVKNQPSAWTSGPSQSKGWSIKMAHSDKWANQLMQWQSGDATVEQPCSLLAFDAPEQAVLFCERNGWPYEVVAEHPQKAPIALDPKSLGNQYSYNIFPLAVQKAMKDSGAPRRARHIFTHPNAPAATGLSTWDNHRHTGYGPDPWKPRNDKVKFDEGAWSGPGWHGKKEIEPTK